MHTFSFSASRGKRREKMANKKLRQQKRAYKRKRRAQERADVTGVQRTMGMIGIVSLVGIVVLTVTRSRRFLLENLLL